MRMLLALILVVAWGTLRADDSFPKPDWQDKPDPLASPDAVVGGEMVYYSGPAPKSLNYYTSFAQDAGMFFGLMFESLLGGNPITLGEEPGLADRWTISDDKKVFTFHLDPNAKWSDGQPVTAHDVKWTCDSIADPKNETGPWQMIMERFDKVEVVDDATIRFTGKEVHWSLLDNCSSLYILPKHAFEGKDLKMINADFPVVSGPYQIGEYKEHRYLQMKRRADWWGSRYKRNQNLSNFERLRFKFYDTPDSAFDAFVNGEFDVYAVSKAAIWVGKTGTERFTSNWIVKQKIVNHNSIGFQGWAMNIRHPPFDDVRVRQAMCHLLDRKTMNKTLMYDQYFLHQSYFEDLYGQDHPCPNKGVEFDKEAARKLLAAAGWTVNPKTGKLEKDGKPFEFTFLARGEDDLRFLAVFRPALEDVGITMNIERKDWASWQKDMDTFNFQMTWAAFGGGGPKKDPQDLWHSKEADRPSGGNITGFKNPEVDALIEKQKTIFDLEQRNDICRQIDALIYKDYPYILLWNINYERLLYWNKFGTPPTVLSKYSDAAGALGYWWLDTDAQAELSNAQKAGKAMPKRPAEVIFDQVYKRK